MRIKRKKGEVRRVLRREEKEKCEEKQFKECEEKRCGRIKRKKNKRRRRGREDYKGRKITWREKEGCGEEKREKENIVSPVLKFNV